MIITPETEEEIRKLKRLRVLRESLLKEEKAKLFMPGDDEARERCQRLLGFAKEAWHILEPKSREFKDGWAVEAIAEHLEHITTGSIQHLLINVPPGFMKLCADSTPILTPDGQRTHGDLKIGDRVFGPDGLPTEVINISEKAIADYEVTFSTHETIKCNGDHLWHVFDRFAHKWITRDTRFLADAKTEKGRNRFFIPDTECLQFPEADLPLDPYFLGCWIGDGTSTKPWITHDQKDAAHIEKIEARGLWVTKRYYQKNTVSSAFTNQNIIETIRVLGIFNKKRIPDRYLFASKAQRYELLAGIIDTDGTVDQKRGRVMIGTCEPDLYDDISRLILSLGMKPYVTKVKAPGYGEYKSDKTYYMIGFQPIEAIPTAIERKKIEPFDFAKRKRAIVSVKKSENPEMGHCITVNREDGLYVVGNTNLITHNSLLTKVFWPAWEWGPMGMPWLRYVSSSYASHLSLRDARKLRRLITSPWYQRLWPEVRLSKDQNSIGNFATTESGFMLASSVGSIGTGERGDRFIDDDPNSVKEAESQKIREETNRWRAEVVPTRVNDPEKSAFIDIQQRTHNYDVTGWLIDKPNRPGNMVHLCIPMEYEHKLKCVTPYWSDPRTKEGELAWPERFSADVVANLKKSLGPYASSAQLQQSPTPRGGGIIKRKWWKYWDEENAKKMGMTADEYPPMEFVIASVDGAYTSKDSNDPSGFTIWGVWRHPTSRHPQVMLMYAWRDRIEFDDLVKRVRKDSKRFGVDKVLVEAKANGLPLAQELRRRFAADFACETIVPVKDKVARTFQIQYIFSQGLVWVPVRTWGEMVVDEVCAMSPTGSMAPHDDLTDSTTQALNWMRRNGWALSKDEGTGEVEIFGKALQDASEPVYDV